ncbi:hypothetical protein BKA93DRAFT_753177 [Sparassis latifolia]
MHSSASSALLWLPQWAPGYCCRCVHRGCHHAIAVYRHGRWLLWYALRHWALLISDNGITGYRCHVVNATPSGGRMKYEVKDNFNIRNSRTYSEHRVGLGVELVGEVSLIFAAIEAVDRPIQRFENFELLPGCQDWCHDVVKALIREGMIPAESLEMLKDIPSRY